MSPKHKRRLIIVILIVTGLVAALALIFYGLKQTANWFYTPSQVHNNEAPSNRTFRIGGLVVPGSIERNPNGDNELAVSFQVTDCKQSVTVEYIGALPDLFREKQGIIALGKLSPNKVLKAEQVLAKHDENYMPPEVAESLAKKHTTIDNKSCLAYQ